MGIRLLSIILNLLFISALRAEAATTFGEQTKACLTIPKKEDFVCLPGAPCPSKEIHSKVEDCLLKIGVTKPIFSSSPEGLQFTSASANKTFPESSGCSLSFAIENGNPVGRLVRPDKNKSSCTFNGYELDKDARLPVASAEKQKDGTWKLPKIVIAVGLDSLLQPSNLLLRAIQEGPGLPNCEENNPFSSDEATTAENGISNLEHFLGFKENQWPFPERHYVGRNGPANFDVIKIFKLKAPGKICGVKFPKGTEITTSFGMMACTAASDGAINIIKLPATLFPELKEPGDNTATVYCRPAAQGASQTTFGHRTPSPNRVPPKVDWQDCDCDLSKVVSDPDHPANR